MTTQRQLDTIRSLFVQGLRDYEICERTRFSLIFVKHAISNIRRDPLNETLHLINRKRKGNPVTVTIVNDDPYCEMADRYEAAL